MQHRDTEILYVYSCMATNIIFLNNNTQHRRTTLSSVIYLFTYSILYYHTVEGTVYRVRYDDTVYSTVYSMTDTGYCGTVLHSTVHGIIRCLLFTVSYSTEYSVSDASQRSFSLR